MKQLLFILCIVAAITAQPNDEFWDNGSLIRSLESYVIVEHNGLKHSIDSITDLNFQWRICSLAEFPILKGQACPYFSEIRKYRNMGSRNSSVYILSDQEVLVGTKYWYQTEDPVDTFYYRIVAYKFTKYRDTYQWDRAYIHSTYTVIRGELKEIK